MRRTRRPRRHPAAAADVSTDAGPCHIAAANPAGPEGSGADGPGGTQAGADDPRHKTDAEALSSGPIWPETQPARQRQVVAGLSFAMMRFGDAPPSVLDEALEAR